MDKGFTEAPPWMARAAAGPAAGDSRKGVQPVRDPNATRRGCLGTGTVQVLVRAAISTTPGDHGWPNTSSPESS